MLLLLSFHQLPCKHKTYWKIQNITSDAQADGTITTLPLDHDVPLLKREDEEQVQAKVFASGLRFAGIMVAVCLSFMLVGIVSWLCISPSSCSDLETTQDNNIIGTAVPAITRSFGTTRDIAWYSSI